MARNIHLDRDAPAAMEGIEYRGDEFDGVPTSPRPSRAVRSWRAGAQSTATVPNAAVALGTEQGHRADAHLSHGSPDLRRGEGKQAAPPARYAPGVESPHNDRDAVVLHPEAAPARPKAGFTGADPTRPALSQRAWLIRKFDQLIAQHPGTVDKAAQPAPLAARPPERKRLIGGLPSASGSAGTGMTPIGGHRNTFRLVPRGWDEKIVNRQTPAPAPSARSRGWRA